MSNKLQKVLKLAKKTGDRIVVFDNSEPDHSFVVMALDEYEEILGISDKNGENSVLTERPIAGKMASSEQNKNWQAESGFPKENVYSSGQIIKNRFKGNNNWSIPKAVKEAAEDVEEYSGE